MMKLKMTKVSESRLRIIVSKLLNNKGRKRKSNCKIFVQLIP